jgi:hypothetical protein
MRLEGLSKLKKENSSELELANFRLVAWCLNELRYCVPPISPCTCSPLKVSRSFEGICRLDLQCREAKQTSVSCLSNGGSGLRSKLPLCTFRSVSAL